MTIDLTETIAPKSDQLNADDLMAGPRTFTIAAVSRGDGEQPINITLAEFGKGRPWKPCKSMRRVLVAAWGKDGATYVGRRLTLYRDNAVRFGGQDVGGIRVSHMSDIEKRLSLALTVTRGKRAPYVVEPLPDVDWIEADSIIADITAVESTSDLDTIAADIKGRLRDSDRERVLAAYQARKAELAEAEA